MTGPQDDAHDPQAVKAAADLRRRDAIIAAVQALADDLAREMAGHRQRRSEPWSTSKSMAYECLDSTWARLTAALETKEAAP